jgi:hypothetical protein
MFFMIAGTACAADVSDVSITEDSNLTSDNVYALSQEKLEVSNEVSISETNMVNSHDDNLEDYPEDAVLASSAESYYEDNGDQILGLANASSEEGISSSDDSLLASSSADVLSVGNISTSLSVSDTHYGKSATYFQVTLQDNNGKALNNQTVSLKVNDKVYSAITSSKGIANIKTEALAVGTYSVTISYAGSSNYANSTLSKNVKVLSSVSGKDLTKYYSAETYFNATFWKDNAALSNTKVTMTIGGKKYTFTTNKKGVAVAKVTLKPGKYTVTTTNPYTGEKITNNLVVKKDTSSIKGPGEKYILPYNYFTYFVTLTSTHGTAVKNAKVVFSYAGKQVTAKTDSNGVASTVIPLLDEGTYKISYKYSGSDGVSGCSGSDKFHIKAASTKLTASDLKKSYKSTAKFSVKATDNSNKPLTNKVIRFILDDKEYSAKTNSKGVAQLSIGVIKPGTHSIKYMYSSLGSKDYNYGYKSIIVDKVSAKLIAKNLVMKYKDGSYYKATVKDSSGKVLKNIVVKFTIKDKTYSKKTNSKGVAQLKINLNVGYYTIKSVISNSFYKSSTVSKHILVNGTKFIAGDAYAPANSAVYYSVKVVDGKKKPIKGVPVKFTVKGKTYTKKSNSNGIAKVKLDKLSAGNYKIKYTHGIFKGTSKLHVIDKVSLKEIISVSNTVKKFVEKNKKLPSTVKIGNVKVSTADYLYLASQAIVNLDSNKKSDVTFKHIENPSKPGSASNKGNLNDYVSVAKDLIKTANSKGKMPNSVDSEVGTIGYKGLVYAFARVVAFYGDEGIMPKYVTIKSLSGTTISTSKLNSKNTIGNLAAYLAASTNCQVNDPKIKQLVAKLTDGLTSDTDKATAIFNYVRDTISYSFYYDTKYGAVGTLNAGRGNCVDHSHLLVAMYRTAGLAARYVHGTCTFSSGTYGHVWTQVLIGDTWVVSDATSARNSFGNVVNWNADSYSLKGYYGSIGF